MTLSPGGSDSHWTMARILGVFDAKAESEWKPGRNIVSAVDIGSFWSLPTAVHK